MESCAETTTTSIGPTDAVVVTSSEEMRQLLKYAERLASSDAKVLITGESGVGKDVIARYIHAHSPRRHREYVAVNCAGVTESLLESELFGHVKGSFTGAYRDKRGKLQLAQSGTLFLDELGEMTPADAGTAASLPRERRDSGGRSRCGQDDPERSRDCGDQPQFDRYGGGRHVPRRPALSALCCAHSCAAAQRATRGRPYPRRPLPAKSRSGTRRSQTTRGTCSRNTGGLVTFVSFKM